LHGLAFALQGIVFLLLLESARAIQVAGALIVCFGLAGTLGAYLWYFWSRIPHAIDMCMGMLTFGNLGMLLGWWADNGFAPLHEGSCRACLEAMRAGVMKPWMWVGMLAFANAAMLWLGRRPVPSGNHAIAMFTGGNVGMVLGMLAGGLMAAQAPIGSVAGAALLALAGMTTGMVAGMLAGTWLTEKLLDGSRHLRIIPHWLRLGHITNSAG
jgi:hypothetical protein